MSRFLKPQKVDHVRNYDTCKGLDIFLDRNDMKFFSVLIDASQKIGKLISNPKFLGMARKPSMFGALPVSSERSEE